MSSTNLSRPFVLTKEEIDRVVKDTAPGAYALGPINEQGGITVKRVGRSDTDLNQRIHDYIGQYSHFRCDFFPTIKDAFEKECTLYHDFKPQDNVIHPDKPNGTNYSCPIVVCPN